MPRLVQASKITAYAVALQVVALAVALPLFVGPEGVGRHLGFATLLCVVGAFSVFLVALLGLRHGRVDSPARGARLGLWAAACFYLIILMFFGVLPASLAILEGRPEEAADYFAAVVRTVAVGSYGLPVIVGAAGGAVYGWLSKAPEEE